MATPSPTTSCMASCMLSRPSSSPRRTVGRAVRWSLLRIASSVSWYVDWVHTLNTGWLTPDAVGSYHRTIRRPYDPSANLRIWRAVYCRGSDRGLVAVRTSREGSDIRGISIHTHFRRTPTYDRLPGWANTRRSTIARHRQPQLTISRNPACGFPRPA